MFLFCLAKSSSSISGLPIQKSLNSIYFFQLLATLSHPKIDRQNIAHQKTDSNLGPKLTLEHRTTTSVLLHVLTSTYGVDCVHRLAAKYTCLDVSGHQYIYL